MATNHLQAIKNILGLNSKVDTLNHTIDRLMEQNVILEERIKSLGSLQHFQKKLAIEQKLLIGKQMANEVSSKDWVEHLHAVEFKVFSQWGDDGIIQYIISKLEVKNKVFIEFGVENYEESNTRFLLINNNWTGLIMDGSDEHMNHVKSDDIFWQHNLIAKKAFITAENINLLIGEENIKGEIGILSIDIDGNDYWVWKQIQVVNPVLVIAEYNSVFGADRPITIPYQPDFIRGKGHYSNLFYGASLPSLCDLAEEKGYAFLGCNSAGNNAYFVRNDKLGRFKPISVQEGFVESQFRESRDESGKLTFLSGTNRIEQIRGMKVYNTRTNQLEAL